jgi:ketosteroid isomerase-like protein
MMRNFITHNPKRQAICVACVGDRHDMRREKCFDGDGQLRKDAGMEDPKASAVDTVLQFLECINQHAVDALAALMTDDHVFIDSLGQSVTGREKMRTGWRGYFAFCPDYWVTHEEILAGGDRVAVFGAAGGTIAAGGSLAAENKWRTTAAWLAIVGGGRVQQWQVYADNKPVYDIIARSKPTQGR